MPAIKSEEKDKRHYELGVLVRTEDELPKIAALLREHGGEIVADFRAKKVALAYPIKKEKEAIFAFAHFDAVGATAKALEQDLILRPTVLRSLVVLLPKPQKKREEGAGAPLPQKRVSAPVRSTAPSESPARQNSWPLSNEALEKKIEEILK